MAIEAKPYKEGKRTGRQRFGHCPVSRKHRVMKLVPQMPHVETSIEPAPASPDPVERPDSDAAKPDAGEPPADGREAPTGDTAQPGVDSDPENPPSGKTIVRVDFKARRRA